MKEKKKNEGEEKEEKRARGLHALTRAPLDPGRFSSQVIKVKILDGSILARDKEAHRSTDDLL